MYKDNLKAILQNSMRRWFYIFTLSLGSVVNLLGIFLGFASLSAYDQFAMPMLQVFFTCMLFIIVFRKKHFLITESVLLGGLLIYFNGLLNYTLTFPEGINHGAEIGMFGCWSIVIYSMFYWVLGRHLGLRICLSYMALTVTSSVLTLSFSLDRLPDTFVLYYLFQVLVSNVFFLLIFEFSAKAIEKSNAVALQMSQAANTDALTKLANRRSVEQHLEEQLDNQSSTGIPFSIILLDIDHFKLVNDTLGHNVGDSVLKELAVLLTSVSRKDDLVGRWGGEEFILLLPNTQLPIALSIANRHREKIEAFDFEHINRITASFGVAEARSSDSQSSLLARADEALYRAKQSGRNLVKAA